MGRPTDRGMMGGGKYPCPLWMQRRVRIEDYRFWPFESTSVIRVGLILGVLCAMTRERFFDPHDLPDCFTMVANSEPKLDVQTIKKSYSCYVINFLPQYILTLSLIASIWSLRITEEGERNPFDINLSLCLASSKDLGGFEASCFLQRKQIRICSCTYSGIRPHGVFEQLRHCDPTWKRL